MTDDPHAARKQRIRDAIREYMAKNGGHEPDAVWQPDGSDEQLPLSKEWLPALQSVDKIFPGAKATHWRKGKAQIWKKNR